MFTVSVQTQTYIEGMEEGWERIKGEREGVWDGITIFSNSRVTTRAHARKSFYDKRVKREGGAEAPQ